MAGVASQAGDADSSRVPGLTSDLQGSVNVSRGALLLVRQWQCISSYVSYIFVTLVPFAVWSWYYSSPRGVRFKCYYAFILVCCGCDTSYIVSVHIQCQASICSLSFCRGHSWRVRLAKQATLTPPGNLVSPLVCRGPWMSTVVLYCWCHSYSASVLLYFTFLITKNICWNWHISPFCTKSFSRTFQFPTKYNCKRVQSCLKICDVTYHNIM